MKYIATLKLWLGRKSVRGALVILLLIVALLAFFTGKDTSEDVISDQVTVVKVTSAAELLGQQELSVIGTVRAFTEAAVTAERSGQVTSVPVSLGQYVQAGQVIATLENASERATVLQAEGAYEAALASAAQSGVGVDQANTNLITARNSAVTSVQGAYSTVNNAVKGTIDTFFTQPESFVPGLRIDGKGSTAFLNSERVAYQGLLSDWQARVNLLNTDDDLIAELELAKKNIDRTIVFIDTFITTFNAQNPNGQYSDAELISFNNTFNGVRSGLLSARSSIDAAINSIKNAEENLTRAQLSASGGANSASDAQVKQALGSLRSAQAALAETILRTPISGTVNTLDVRTGDFIGSFTTVAKVANNNALEIVTFVGDKERALLSIGDTVMIEGNQEAVITEIAPAVDTTTGKTEVRIAFEGSQIQNGDTVRITKNSSETAVVIDRIFVPISAVKFTADNGTMFVVEDGTLVSIPVEIGQVRSNTVEISSGLTADKQFVSDARGLQAGESVEIAE